MAAEIVLIIVGGDYDCTTWEAPLTPKESCEQHNVQNCHECEDYACGDNLNPQIGSMADSPANVKCHKCGRESTAMNIHVFYKEAGKITCCDCLITENGG
jgi:hypothetical protein